MKIFCYERMKPRLEFWNVRRENRTVSSHVFEGKRMTMIEEAIQGISGEPLEKEKDDLEKFLQDEISRQPFLKKIINQKNLWISHCTGVEAEKDVLKKCVRNIFAANSKAARLSPLLVIIAHYLLYVNNWEVGRKPLLKLLYLQEAGNRLKIHNLLATDNLPEGTMMAHGEKIEQLR